MEIRTRTKSGPRLLGRTLALSLILHIVFVGFKYDFVTLEEREIPGKKVTKQIVVKLREMPKQKVEKRGKKRQIVETILDTPSPESKPETRFLSAQTQRVDKQSVARRVDSFKEAGFGEKDGMEIEIQREASSVAEGNKTSPARDRPPGKGRVRLSDLAALSHMRPLTPKGEKEGRKDHRGLAASNDYIDDIPLGDMTKLNTLEFKYYGFYHRIKQKLEQYWGYAVRQKITGLIRRGGRRPASAESITSLAITLNSKGSIVDIQVKSPSGVQELDEAAIESFNKAGPFPNPPEGMLKDGLAKIEWGFVVKS